MGRRRLGGGRGEEGGAVVMRERGCVLTGGRKGGRGWQEGGSVLTGSCAGRCELDVPPPIPRDSGAAGTAGAGRAAPPR